MGGWGSTFGPTQQAVGCSRRKGLNGSHIDRRRLQRQMCIRGNLLMSYGKIIVPEMNTGQFKTLLRDQFLVDATTISR